MNGTIECKYLVTQEKEITKNGKGKVITTVLKQKREILSDTGHIQ
jgi:hypothetical protein